MKFCEKFWKMLKYGQRNLKIIEKIKEVPSKETFGEILNKSKW